ncbi:acetamidase/formamidase family protein [Photobacterium sp. DNB23_23_1]|uniref:Acetamidase/formamidase family protein n=1 Tax=Photobacterium pectinilyticum TaxID=2906793 RepID=A0ABT1MYR9_9GAMM|nr:acetamidase/formamidase family protein [Photobacterium sp. ZSDE20]MCQ1057651.1 acetamidase/formamidase family protein [Photobacterium sp. ZSDE20]MDD1821944.1 acetamidase/formamidase family protein [Photobacterium sp. ZSDE20]
MKKLSSLALLVASFSASAVVMDGVEILQPLYDEPTFIESGKYAQSLYIPSTLDTIMWGYLPNKLTQPVATIDSGSTVVFDTVSHEGLLEDQGRDPLKYFGAHGYSTEYVLEDAVQITGSDLEHDFYKDGPHIVTGPVKIKGAKPGDVLKVDIVKLEPRVPYGVISNRHGKGALVGEYPKRKPQPNPSAEHPERFGNVSILSPIFKEDDKYFGKLKSGDKNIVFPLNPFMGIMGVAPDKEFPIHSVAPQYFGGNLDVKDLVEGTTAYYRVNVDGAMFYTGDSHFTQGDGEVALTALEASVRATFKLTILREGSDAIPGAFIDTPVGETAEFWIPVGLDEDLNIAMQNATRESIRFLVNHYGISEEIALAYLSANTDFAVSQVVDKTKGIHAKIRKADFAEFE